MRGRVRARRRAGRKLLAAVLALGVGSLLGFGLFVACGRGAPPAPTEGATAEGPPASLGEEPPEPSAGGERPEEPDPELPGALLAVVENSPDARPQSGLEAADLVYEIEAEGGITRFLAVFYRHSAPEIGPIRSAREYTVDLARAYGLPFAHAGGSDEARRLLGAGGVRDLDEIRNAGEAFRRVAHRRMPHNLYTSTEQLTRAAERRGWEPKRLADLPRGSLPPGGIPTEEVRILYLDTPQYRYATSYLWSGEVWEKAVNGHPFRTAHGDPIRAGNVLVLTASMERYRQRNDWLWVIDWAAGGEASLLRDGRRFAGRWAWRPGGGHPFTLEGADGGPLPLAPGSVWVHVLPDWKPVNFVPQPGAAG